MNALTRFSLLAALFAVAACDSFFGPGDKPPLPGERIAVLQRADVIAPDPALAGVALALPEPAANKDWPQAGDLPNHEGGNLVLAPSPRETWTADIGIGSSLSHRILSSPVVADGHIYAMDSQSTVSAFDAASGHRLWQVRLKPGDEDDSDFFGGGVAYDGGRLFVSTGFARIYALEGATGKEIWNERVAAPVRAAPTVSEGRVFVVTLDNQTVALSAADGRKLWDHSGLSETAGLIGGASPAVAGSVVIAPYSSGELFAMRVENGRVVWSDSLANVERSNAINSLSDIGGRPVVDHDLVFATSHAGRTLAIDLRRGARAWELETGGTADLWVAGDSIFMIAGDDRLIAVTRNDGRVRWAQQLEQYRNAKKKTGPISWAGPVLAGGRLYVVGTNGKMLAIAPQDGSTAGSIDLPAGSSIAPVVANGALYVVTDAGALVAYR